MSPITGDMSKGNIQMPMSMTWMQSRIYHGANGAGAPGPPHLRGPYTSFCGLPPPTIFIGKNF